jgi:hypothetical protein
MRREITAKRSGNFIGEGQAESDTGSCAGLTMLPLRGKGHDVMFESYLDWTSCIRQLKHNLILFSLKANAQLIVAYRKLHHTVD